jgi:LuxR family transcriptional regulator, activator of tox operons
METYTLEATRARCNPFKRCIGDLIASVGSPSFERSLFQIAREATNCEHVTAFVSTDRSLARLLFAVNRGAKPIARTIADKYLKHYWNHDPANVICSGNAAPSYEFAVRVYSNDIDHVAYRWDCYSSVDLVDRLSIIRRSNDETIRLNLYRSGRRGRFAAGEVDSVLENATLMFALIAKHDAQRHALSETGKLEIARRRLAHAAPELSARERDVCLGIMQGQSSEAIALGLGISINTVLTYRKRAYARLGISSHNELMRLALM